MDENGQKQTLTKKQLKAIPLILEAKTIMEGCEKAGVSKASFYAWLKNHEFKSEFVRQRQELVDHAFHALKISAGDAVNVLIELLKANAENVRLRTAQAILDNVLKAVEIENLEKRLTELERSLKK